MLESSLAVRIYYFACDFLWCVLSLFHYLDEEIAQETISSHYLFKWSTQFEDLAGWLGEARFFPLDRENISRSEKDLFFSTSDKLGDSLIFHWGNELNTVATEMHKGHPQISESEWLYYYYCWFLRQTLTEFEHVLQEPNSAAVYYEHYREYVTLFYNLAAAIERERPFLSMEADIDEKAAEVVWSRLNSRALKLGAEWRQAVLSAAHSLKLPDF